MSLFKDCCVCHIYDRTLRTLNWSAWPVLWVGQVKMWLHIVSIPKTLTFLVVKAARNNCKNRLFVSLALKKSKTLQELLISLPSCLQFIQGPAVLRLVYLSCVVVLCSNLCHQQLTGSNSAPNKMGETNWFASPLPQRLRTKIIIIIIIIKMMHN